jgi:hypothetical protein
MFAMCFSTAPTVRTRSSAIAAFDRPSAMRASTSSSRGVSASSGLVTAVRILSASPVLQAREREVSAQYTHTLAELIAEETGKPREDVEAAVVASALMGAQRTLVDYVRASVMAGRRGPELTADARTQGRRAFKRLERGLADYAIKR